MGAQSWEDILHLTTGWSLVKRDDVTKVAGDSGIPWVNMAFKRGGTLFDSNDDFFALIQPVNPNKGFHFEFFTFGGGDARKWRLDITYLDNPAFHGYWEKASRVLSDLVYGHSSIKNEVSGSTDGAEADGVRLSDFAKLAKSFDDAGRFFDERIQNLQDWKDELGNEQAGWKGNAAGAFWLLLDDLHKKYENYLSQLRPPGFTSTHTSPSTNTTSSTLHGDNLIGAEEALYKAYQELYRIYGDFYWQRGEQITTTLPDGSTTQQNIPADPLDVLNQVFVEMGRWIIDNNARQWAMGPYSVDDGEQSGDNFYFTKNFKQESQFGALSDTASWHNLVNEAVSRWVKNVEINLDKKAQPVLETLQKDWSRVLNPSWNSAFSFTDAPSTLTSDVQDENNEKNGNDLGNGLKGLGDGITKLGDGITNGFKGLGDGIGDGFKGLGDGMGNNFKALGDGIGNHVPTVNGNGGFGDVPSTGPNGANVPGGGNVQVPKPNIPNIQGNGGFGDLPTGNSLLGGGGALGAGGRLSTAVCPSATSTAAPRPGPVGVSSPTIRTAAR
ncbi:hypothetical protein CF54_15970 [Streptomyces sp. Tu 6176]|uniref:AAWKG family protein n=1 Tax=Streptomyces sp. Tu 6176 TaxID=1470557 RepID=UPI000451DE99|nr:AAWKG family protein [Streptomyces sp. Tu 6176]EYT82002.1 hypothetical protein CF54_15970 [Streptomyces sp. Tu 6176]